MSSYSGGVEIRLRDLRQRASRLPQRDGSTALATNGPVDVELFSWSTNPSDPFENFQSFLNGNDVDGILGIGQNTAGPDTSSPFESYGGVLVDVPHGQLVVGD